MYLIFDSSAIDKPKNWKAPFSDTFSWPRMIHLSWITLDAELNPTDNQNFLIKPEGFEIDSEIEERCKVNAEDIKNKGVPLAEALHAFEFGLKDVEYVGAHNLNFNENVLAAEYVRKGINHDLFKKTRFCLMQEATFFCKLPSKTGGYKWPTLSELHSIIFKKAYSPPNNARADVIAATRCFKALKMGKQLDDFFED